MYLQAKIFVGEVITNAKTLGYDVVKGFCGMVKGFQVIELMGSVLNKGETQAMRQTGGRGGVLQGLLGSARSSCIILRGSHWKFIHIRKVWSYLCFQKYYSSDITCDHSPQLLRALRLCIFRIV